MTDNKLELATIGGGCFWCIEAIFSEVNGVENVNSGYAGGNVPGKPTYREVCSGLTGHAEVVQIAFNPFILTFEDLLVIFMTSHDPTTLNRQGADFGTQYRSVIYYQDELQKQIALEVIAAMDPYYEDPIITELSPLKMFYTAEDDHQNYYANNKAQGYCSAVITPKLARLRKMHADKLKHEI